VKTGSRTYKNLVATCLKENNSIPSKPMKKTKDFKFPARCSKKDEFVRTTCMKLMDNVLSRISEYAHEWKHLDDDKKHKLALFKANFAVDYFCSNVVTICDAIYKNYKEDANGDTIKIGRKLYDQREEWFEADPSYSIFKKDSMNSSYDTAVSEAIQVFKGMVGAFKHIQQSEYPNPSKAELYMVTRKTIDKFTSYYPSGYGMYRFANMHNFEWMLPSANAHANAHANAKPTMIEIKDTRCPCSCICNSLLFLTLLLVSGIPSKYLYFIAQKPKKQIKQTHWAASIECENLIKLDFGIYNEYDLDEFPLNSMVTFDKFTNEIVYYYNRNFNNTYTGASEIKQEILSMFSFKLQDIYL
jgi:hypothetical protein